MIGNIPYFQTNPFDSVDSETASFPGLVLSSASAVRSKSCLNKSAIENHKDRSSTTQCQFIQQNFVSLVRFSLFHLFLVRLVTTIIFLCLFWHAQLLSAKHQRCSLSAFHHLCSRVIESSSHRSGFTRAGTPRYWRKKWPKARPATWQPRMPRMPRIGQLDYTAKNGTGTSGAKKNYKSNMNESDSVVKWWDPILNCTSFNQCMGMKSTAFTPQALMISVRTET